MKKIPIVSVIGLFVPVLLAVQSASADTAADLKQAEGLYKAGQYAQAGQMYQKVLSAESGKEEVAVSAREGLAAIYVVTDRLPQAKEAMKELLAKHSAYERLPHAVHGIIERAEASGKTLQAGQICQSILADQPDHPQAIWLKMGVAVAGVYLNDGQAVNAGVQDITAHHDSDPWSAEALAQIGWAYDKVAKYEKARPLYEYVVDHWRDKPRAIHAHTALVRGCIHLKNKQAAKIRLDQLIGRYTQDTQLPGVLNQIARVYRESRMYRESKQVSQYVLDRHPDSDQRIGAQRTFVLCDVELGNHDAAAAGIQKLITDCAKDRRLPSILTEVAGVCLESRMYDQAKHASQYVFDHYPDSNQRIQAQKTLVLCEVQLHSQQAADAGIQKLVADCAKDPRLPSVLNEIAGVCRESRMYEPAKQVSQYILNHYPDSDQRIRAQRDLVLCDVELGSQEPAHDGIQKLVADYANDKRLPNVLTEIAKVCRESRMYEQSKQVSRYILDHLPDSDQRIWADKNTLLCDIRLHNQDAAQTACQEFVNRYARDDRLANVLVQISGECLEAKMYGQSRSVCQYILDQLPDSRQCLSAQRDIVISALMLRDFETADAESQKLVSRFTSRQDALMAINQVAKANSDLGRHEQARELFRSNLINYPDSDNAVWALRGIIAESVALKDEAGIDAGIQKLLGLYSTSKNFPMAVVNVGRNLMEARHPRASEMFQYVIDKHPDHEQALFAKIGMGLVHLLRGADSQAEAIFQETTAQYANHPRLAEAVSLIAEGYYVRALKEEQEGRREAAIRSFGNTVEKCRTIIEEFPPVSGSTPDTHLLMALAYRDLKEYEKAIEHFGVITSQWPRWERAYRAQYEIARCWEFLGKSNKIPMSDAATEVVHACAQMIANYPDCEMIHMVRPYLEYWLNIKERYSGDTKK